MSLRNVSTGSSGPDVKAIQQALNTWGANPRLETDGKFGSHTDKAVREFQAAHQLRPDGIAGRLTRAALFPVGVSTTTVSGFRLRMPDFPSFAPKFGLPGKASPQQGFGMPPLRLTLNVDWSSQICQGLSCLAFPLLKLPRLSFPIPAPALPDWNLSIPPALSPAGSSPFGFVYDHVELQPGAQSTFSFGAQRADAFVLTMQNVYRRGPDSGAHREVDLGVQIGTPFSNPNGPWTVNPFVQLTDVDRLGALGMFHLWQPYAAIGFQFSGLGNPQPSLTGNLFPINLGLDIGDSLTLSFGAGLALTLDLRSGLVQAGPQITSGLSLKFGKPASNTP